MLILRIRIFFLR